jgi:DNA (cytosine-5)-methyltransferase 1
MNNMSNFRFIDLFAGIGGMRIPFEKLGGECVFSSEWDEHAQRTYYHNFGEMPKGDITKIDERDIPDHDILLAGFPCQPFSIIGEKQGFADTRGTLFFDIERILAEKKPSAFLLENVKQLASHDGGRTFAVIQSRLLNLGYTVYYEVLNALDFGLPQKRERVFIVGFREPIAFAFPRRNGNYKSLSGILEPDDKVDSSLFASEKIQKSRIEKCKVNPFYPSIWHENKGGNISVLPFSCALRAGASYNYLLVNGIRRLSGRELLRLQGFPEDFKVVVNITQLRKQTGNSVAIPVVTAIAEKMLEALQKRELVWAATEQLTLFEKGKGFMFNEQPDR